MNPYQFWSGAYTAATMAGNAAYWYAAARRARSNPNNIVRRMRKRYTRKRKYPIMGASGAKFKRTYSRQQKSYPVVIRTERHGTLTVLGDTALYNGHGLSAKYAMKVMWYGIFYQLFKKNGIVVDNWFKNYQSGAQVCIEFQISDSANTSSRTTCFEFGSGAQFFAYPDKFFEWMADLIRGSGAGAGDADVLVLQSIQMRTEDTTTTTPAYREATRMQLTEGLIKLGWTSNLKLQNVTEGGAAGQNETDFVTRNPLRGKTYFGYGNGPEFKNLYGTTALPNPEIFARDTGLISWDRTNWNAQMTQITQRPFNASAFKGIKSTGNAMLQPGQIKSDNLRMAKTMKLNTLVKMLIQPFKRYQDGAIDAGGVIQGIVKFPLGTFKLFGWEKMIGTGQQIQIAYEIDQGYRSKFIEKSPVCDEVHELLTPP